MLLKPIGLIVLLVGGFALGRLQLTLRGRSVALAVLLVILAQAGLKLALPHAAIEEFAQRHVSTSVGPFVLIGIALLETAGVWIPALLIGWTAVAARVWGTLCLITAAVLSAAVYYFPFDVVIINGEVVGPKHPQYELGLLFLLPVAVAGYFAGWYTRRLHGRVKTA